MSRSWRAVCCFIVVFQLVAPSYCGKPVDGGWSPWNGFSQCSLTCGQGTKWRLRQCSHPMPINGGKDCVGDYKQTVPCWSGKPCVDQIHGKTTGGFTDNQKAHLVEAHNALRRLAGATNMHAVEWDTGLEQSAQEAADGCKMRHTTGRYTQKYGYVGENIRATVAGFMGEEPVKAWWREIQFYNYTSNSCVPGEVCGHYTQVVWAATHSIGCGVRYCPYIRKWKKHGHMGGYLVFCHYGPAGNYRQSVPYTAGTPCSECPVEAPYCVDNLCSEHSPTETPTDTYHHHQHAHVLNANTYCQSQSHSGEASHLCLSRWLYGGRKPEGDHMCQTLYCSVSSTHNSCSPVPSADGVLCGVGKICKGGKCQDDPTNQTDSLRPDCLHGDQAMILDWATRTKVSCVEYLRLYGLGECGREEVRELCCHTCETRRDTGSRDCPYGDEYPVWCPKVGLEHRRWLCMSGYRTKCCATCSAKSVPALIRARKWKELEWLKEMKESEDNGSH